MLTTCRAPPSSTPQTRPLLLCFFVLNTHPLLFPAPPLPPLRLLFLCSISPPSNVLLFLLHLFFLRCLSPPFTLSLPLLFLYSPTSSSSSCSSTSISLFFGGSSTVASPSFNSSISSFSSVRLDFFPSSSSSFPFPLFCSSCSSPSLSLSLIFPFPATSPNTFFLPSFPSFLSSFSSSLHTHKSLTSLLLIPSSSSSWRPPLLFHTHSKS